jgi:hypothetical protein
MPDENDLVYKQYGLDVGSLLRALYERLTGVQPQGGIDSVTETLLSFWHIFSIVSFAFSALLLFGIIYAKLRLHELEELEMHHLHEAEHQFAHTHAHASKNQRWEDTIAHVDSDNPNDWRLAIIEADIILEELLTKLGYPGLTIGDKLKQASPQFFKTIEDAWKAHKVRNEIAHRGSDFILTKRLARETIEQYRRVFEEHDVI